MSSEIINQAQAKDGTKTPKSNIVKVPYQKLVTLDKSTSFTGPAMPGDTITWKIIINNPNTTPKTNILFSDTLDANTSYVAGTFKVNGTPQTPSTTSPSITYTIPTIPNGSGAAIEFDVLVL